MVAKMYGDKFSKHVFLHYYIPTYLHKCLNENNVGYIYIHIWLEMCVCAGLSWREGKRRHFPGPEFEYQILEPSTVCLKSELASYFQVVLFENGFFRQTIVFFMLLNSLSQPKKFLPVPGFSLRGPGCMGKM